MISQLTNQEFKKLLRETYGRIHPALFYPLIADSLRNLRANPSNDDLQRVYDHRREKARKWNLSQGLISAPAQEYRETLARWETEMNLYPESIKIDKKGPGGRSDTRQITLGDHLDSEVFGDELVGTLHEICALFPETLELQPA